MAKCQLVISIDEPQRTYRAGDRLSGRVRVHVDKDVVCNGLTLGVRWTTHGRGDRDQGPESMWRLHEGQWRAGQQLDYPFELSVPQGPVTYRGNLINIDWGVRARADIPWAIDPKAAADFVVVAPSPDEAELGGSDLADRGDAVAQDWDGETGSSRRPPSTLAMVGPLFFAAIALGWGGAQMFGATEFGPAAFLCVIVGLVLLFVGITAIVKATVIHLTRKRLGIVHFECSRSLARCGDDIRLRVLIEPPGTVLLRSIAARLVCTETAISGSGTKQTTDRKAVSVTTLELHGGGTFNAPSRIDGRGTLSIPEDAGLSFAANSNTVAWHVEVRVDLPRFPDWVETVPITVHG